MTLSALSLIQCPFCDGGTGQIAINVPALNEVRQKCPKMDCKNTDLVVRTLASHGVVVFNSTAEAEEPCEHLIHVLIDFDPFEWAGCFAWKCPSLDDVADYLWDLLPFTTAPMLVPKTRHDCLTHERLSWQGVEGAGKLVHHDVLGSAWFAENRVQFIEELRALEDRRQKFYKTDEGTKTFDKLRKMFPR
jgi:hypothetical protein